MHEVEDDRQARVVRRVDEAAQRVGPAVRLVHRVQRDAVVAPAVRPVERAQRHQLDVADAEVAQVPEVRDRGVERPGSR